MSSKYKMSPAGAFNIEKYNKYLSELQKLTKELKQSQKEIENIIKNTPRKSVKIFIKKDGKKKKSKRKYKKSI
jgi:hypothetical protein